MNKQNWTIGNTVKVGFLTLKVTGYDAYGNAELVSSKGIKYVFKPYQGLTRIN